MLRNCAVNGSLSRAFWVLFAPPITVEIESEMCQQSAIKRPDEIYPVYRRHYLMLQNNKTQGQEVRETYLGGIDSTIQVQVVPDQAFRYTCRLNIVASGSNWGTPDEMKWRGNISLPRLFAPTLRAEALQSPPHYRQSHFVLWVRESRDYSRKTTGRKNELHGVEPRYLLPLFP